MRCPDLITNDKVEPGACETPMAEVRCLDRWKIVEYARKEQSGGPVVAISPETDHTVRHTSTGPDPCRPARPPPTRAGHFPCRWRAYSRR